MKIIDFDSNITKLCSYLSVNKPPLVQVMAWCPTGDVQLAEPMMT